MKKKLISLLCGIVLISSSACGLGPDDPINSPSPTTTQPSPTDVLPEYDVSEVFGDSGYKNGFKLHGLDSSTDSGIVKTIDYGNSNLDPVWRLAQWWSKYNLKDGAETLNNNVYTLQDASKKVVVDLNSGSISLGLNAGKEFAKGNTVAPLKWPHLLLSQDIEPVAIGNADKVNARLNFTINKSIKLYEDTAFQGQFAWFIYIKDMNPSSPGYNNFLWFGLNIFDTTKINAPGHMAQDNAGGLGSYIYALGAQEFISGRVRAGQNVSFEVDIKPFVTQALAKAQSDGFMLGTTVDDCYISGTNIGWEVFDRWDLDVTIFDIGVQTLTKI